MIINDETITEVLEVLYHKIYLKEGEILKKDENLEDVISNYILQGNFFIDTTIYLKEDTGHINLDDIRLCLKQLAYAGIAQLLKDKPSLVKGVDYDLFKEKKLGVSEPAFTFRGRELINKKDFSLEMSLNGLRKSGDAYILFVDYKVENKSHGAITYVLKLNK